MAAPHPTPRSHQLPPELPHMPDVSPKLSNHLKTTALWVKNSLDSKLDSRTALPGILLQAFDAPAGTTPAVFMLQVNTAGTIVLTPVPLGGGP